MSYEGFTTIRTTDYFSKGKTMTLPNYAPCYCDSAYHAEGHPAPVAAPRTFQYETLVSTEGNMTTISGFDGVTRQEFATLSPIQVARLIAQLGQALANLEK